MVAGREASPKDVANTQKLDEYWVHGKGAALIRWGEPHDFDRCVRELGKYIHGDQLKGHCANLHKKALGVWPGQEGPGHRGNKGHA
jgi:hypothetical protein